MPEDESPETDRSEPASPWPSRAPRKPTRHTNANSSSTQEPRSPPNDTPMESGSQPNNPLHGVKLADILEYLVEEYGWEGLSARIDVRCFSIDPSIKSSLKFLRRTQWARDKVERLYLRTIRKRSSD